jgi:release factor glutamine methyltransferase
MMRLGSEKLQNAGLDDPRGESRRLLCLVAGYSAATLIAREQDAASEDLQTAYEMAVSLRAERHPFAHIAGRADFFGLEFWSDGRALIPRADSECVVELALSRIPEDADWSLADLGTGTGVLLAALLSQRSSARGAAIEQSKAALSLAAENFAHLDLNQRVELLHGSWAGWTGWNGCDLIISNPPYICSDVIPDLEPEVRDYDPMDALDGGPDGLDAYREIIALAARHMKPGAHLVLEIGFDQRAAVTDLLQSAEFQQIEHRRDLGGNDRAIAATKT